MAEKDLISKDLIKRLIQEISTHIFGLNLDSIEVLETQFQRIEERRADIVVKVTEAGRTYILHIEIQNNNQSIMPVRMLRYKTDLIFQYPHIDIVQYVIYIGKAPLSMSSAIISEGIDYQYHLIDMHTIDCQHFLQHSNPDALVLAILCDFKDQDASDVIHYIIQELKIYHQENEQGFRTSMLALEILSTNRDLKEQVQYEEKKMLSMRWDELPSYDIGLEQGLEKGIEKGIEKGEKKGKIRGKEEVALKMKHKGYAITDIADITGLSIDQITAL